MKHFVLTLLAGLLLSAAASATATIPPNEPSEGCTGYWQTRDNKSVVWIYKAKDGNYYGKIIWLKDPNDSDGKPKVDKNNPDEARRKDPVVGLLILRAFKYNSDDKKWDEGRVYDPENGKDYKCHMTLTDGNTLEVRGYVGFSLLGRTEVWKRTAKP